MSHIFRNFFKNNHIRAYLKSDVLSIVPEVLIAEMTEAKHWFSITSTFFEASATSITWQSSTYLKKSISVKNRDQRFLNFFYFQINNMSNHLPVNFLSNWTGTDGP